METASYQPADLEFAAELLNRGESLDAVREKLAERGLSPDAMTLLIRDLMFGPEPPEDAATRGARWWARIGGGLVLVLGLLWLVLSFTGVAQTDDAAWFGAKLTLAGLLILASGEFVG